MPQCRFQIAIFLKQPAGLRSGNTNGRFFLTEKKSKRNLHPYIIVVAIVIIAAFLGRFLPAGSYERYIGIGVRTFVDPETFHFVERSAFSLTKVMTAIPRGIVDAANVVFITLAIGGAFGVIKKTGMLNIAIKAMVKKFSGNKLAIIWVLSFAFAIICGFIGVPELCLVYIPVLMPLFFALGFDSMVTVALSLTSTAAGFGCAWSAPATTGLGQTIAELPLYSGMPFRMVSCLVLTVTAALYISVYAKKILANPQASCVYEDDIEKKELFAGDDNAEMAPRVKPAGIAAILLFIGLIVGIVINSWGFNEMSGYFILMAVIIGLVAGFGINETCYAFSAGMGEMLTGALICGIARGIAIVLQDAVVMDTIIMYLAKIVTALPATAAGIGMLIVVTLFNGVLASGSGKAVIALPIMIPLGDMVGVNRQIAILAYQMGDSITNILWPASGYYMAALALGMVSFKKWVKWALPLIIIWLVCAAILIAIATAMNWGPF